ncbi:hypothetical protein BJV77DRAFT_1071309 [Russula vinacea]|nr:hypothetical protein BJV77DRAFT_1071309 [Russula vinacea]
MPYVDVEASFAYPTPAAPNIFDTLIEVSGHTLLVSAYFDDRVEINPNLRRDFPLIPWRGEIAVLFVGKTKPFLTRGPPKSTIHFAIAQYLGVCIGHAELGLAFPAYMTVIDGPDPSADFEYGYTGGEV